jgi:hypothetical protein
MTGRSRRGFAEISAFARLRPIRSLYWMTKYRASGELETLDLAIQQLAEGSLAALRSLVVDSVSAPHGCTTRGRGVGSGS